MDRKFNICVLTPVIHNTISQNIISGILGRGTCRDVKITIVSAGGIKNEKGLININRELYDNVLSNEKFDGIIILAGIISQYSTENEFKKFLNSLPKELPIVNIAVDVPGFKSVIVDNISPIETLVDHLIKDHNKSKLMFISGPLEQFEAKLRFKGYKNALIKNNIKIDENYILQGDFTSKTSSRIFKKFINSGLDLPDAIVCVDDDSALGIYSELKKNNIKIGQNGIAVTGFDNMNYSKTMEPCLTTVEQSFLLQGRSAVDTIIAMITNTEIEPEPIISKIIYRKSCGCHDCSSYSVSDTEEDFLESINRRIDDVQIDHIEDHIDRIAGNLNKFRDDNSFNFVEGILPYIELYKYKGYNLNSLLEMIKFLSKRIISELDKDGLIKYYEQIDKINQNIITALSINNVKEFRTFNEQSSELDSVLMDLASCLEFKDLELVLNTNFYYLGIKDFSLVFPKSDDKYLEKLSLKVYSKDDSLKRINKNYCTLYLPLNTKNESGYCRFNILLNSFHIGEVLSYQISRSIYFIELLAGLNSKIKEIKNSYKDLRITKNLLMENEQLANIGGLVAGFTHEISTPIGISVTATTHLMDEINRFRNLFFENNIKKNDMSYFIEQSEETMKILLNNLNRTSSLINGFKQISVDQASDIKRKFELGSYLQEIVFSLSPILRRGKHKVNVQSASGIFLNSYPGAISQIITNLIQNSVKHGFENMEEGQILITVLNEDDNVTIIYKDNGIGIKPELQDKIFNTYYSTKIGHGGSGLGLSIIKKLTENKLLGSIQCSGDGSEGAMFIIKLPH